MLAPLFHDAIHLCIIIVADPFFLSPCLSLLLPLLYSLSASVSTQRPLFLLVFLPFRCRWIIYPSLSLAFSLSEFDEALCAIRALVLAGFSSSPSLHSLPLCMCIRPLYEACARHLVDKWSGKNVSSLNNIDEDKCYSHSQISQLAASSSCAAHSHPHSSCGLVWTSHRWWWVQ